tara:strand:- start:5906 stop:6217 length:312 start_codon:yes stop_codon:yes gene_type:complete
MPGEDDSDEFQQKNASSDVFESAWGLTKNEFYDSATPAASQQSIGEGGNIQAQQVQKLHSYLSMATSMADELGLDEIESMMVEAQQILEDFSPGSEDEYYGRL